MRRTAHVVLLEFQVRHQQGNEGICLDCGLVKGLYIWRERPDGGAKSGPCVHTAAKQSETMFKTELGL